MSIGTRVQQARGELGWSQKRLDAEAGLCLGHTAKVEQRDSDVTTTVAVALADALGVDLSWLITGRVTPGRASARGAARPRGSRAGVPA